MRHFTICGHRVRCCLPHLTQSLTGELPATLCRNRNTLLAIQPLRISPALGMDACFSVMCCVDRRTQRPSANGPIPHTASPVSCPDGFRT
jgi:hypothetical protein